MRRVLVAMFALLCLTLGHQVWAAKVGAGLGARSSATHPQFPTESQGESMQTSLGFRVQEEVFSTLFSGEVDLVGNIAYNGEDSSQNLLVSNSLQRNFFEVGVEMKNVLQITEESEEGQTGVETLSTKLEISRQMLPNIRGRIVGGYNYNHFNKSNLLTGLGLSTEALSCVIDIDLWTGESQSLVGRVSKEVNFFKFTLGTLTDTTTQDSKVWFEVRMSIDDLSVISQY